MSMDDDLVNKPTLGAADDEDELDYDLDYTVEDRTSPDVISGNASQEGYDVEDGDPLDVDGDGRISASEAVAGLTDSDTPASEEMIGDGGEAAEADLIQRRNSLL